MTKILGIASVCVCFIGLTACAKALPDGSAHQPSSPAVSVTAQKYFTVAVKKRWYGGCKVEVNPDKEDQKVRLEMGMTGAWIASNECSAETGVELLEFVRGSTKLTAADIFEDIVKTDYTWSGKVKKDDKLKGRWKYTAAVGTHMKDPDIIIF